MTKVKNRETKDNEKDDQEGRNQKTIKGERHERRKVRETKRN